MQQDIDTRLAEIHIGLSNLRDDPELNGPMGMAGYSAERINQLLDLHQQAFDAVEKQRSEYGDQYGATQDFHAAWDAADTVYMRYVRLARVVFKDDVARRVALGLDGRRKHSFSGWQSQARQFYDSALADAEIQNALATVGITQQALQDGLALMEAADQERHRQQKEIGEAQEATQARDALLDDIFEEWADLVEIARVVFADDPQKLERMGILARSE